VDALSGQDPAAGTAAEAAAAEDPNPQFKMMKIILFYFIGQE
jgi:hypothetical protein